MDYYIAPDGNDNNSGTGPNQPWQTWPHALAQLHPGDTLFVLSGNYTAAANGGILLINCGPNGNCQNGTQGSPITIKAHFERQARLEAAQITAPVGTPYEAFRIENGSYWNIEGLEVHSDGQLTDHGFFGGLLHVIDSHHIKIRRCVAQKTKRSGPIDPNTGLPNPHANHHGILIQGSTFGMTHNILVEECEVYHFHRHGISASRVTDVIFRRNYANGNPEVQLNINSTDSNDQPTGFAFYPATHGIMENNISENNFNGFSLKDGGGDGSNISDNLLAGNISLNDHHGIGLSVDPTNSPPNTFPFNIRIGNQLIADPRCAGMLLGPPGVTDLEVVNLSLLAKLDPDCDETNYKEKGLIVLKDLPDGNLADSATFKNVLVLRFSEKQPQRPAFNIGNYSFFQIANTVSSGSNPNFPPLPYDAPQPAGGWGNDDQDPNAGLTVGFRVGLDYGDCMVHIPSGNPHLHQMGENGADIGANVVCRYENGELTGQALWDPVTGRFPCGVDVLGLGNRCQTVHGRLHVGTLGCPIPSCGSPPLRGWLAIDPLSLILSNKAYVMLTLPDPPPWDVFLDQVRQQMRRMSPEEKRNAVARVNAFIDRARALQQELNKP